MKGGVRHDINKRRILRKKSDLLRSYGVYTLSISFAFFGIYCFNNWMNPREYQSKEE